MFLYTLGSAMCSFIEFLSRTECHASRNNLCRHIDDLSTIDVFPGLANNFLICLATHHILNYSFVSMLISPLRLVDMYKKQKNFEVKMRRRGLINMQTNE